jgi:DNA polymerase IV (family X)
MNTTTEIQKIISQLEEFERSYKQELLKSDKNLTEREREQKKNYMVINLLGFAEYSCKDLKEKLLLAEMEKPSLYETTARTKTFTVNKEIAAHLMELGEMTSDFYKTAAYEKAANIIGTLDHEVESGESLLEIPGIGKGIAAKVNAFLDEYYESESDSDAESVASNEGQILEDSDDETDDESDSEFFVSYNPDLTDIFDKLASLEDDSHKRNTYRTAADTISTLEFKVMSGKDVKGIGKGIPKIIDEFLETGKVRKLEKLEKVVSTNGSDC